MIHLYNKNLVPCYTINDGIIMTIKKELLNELNEKQLKQLAENKGINFQLNDIQTKYYADWDEKDKIVDIMADQKHISVSEIEQFILERKSE